MLEIYIIITCLIFNTEWFISNIISKITLKIGQIQINIFVFLFIYFILGCTPYIFIIFIDSLCVIGTRRWPLKIYKSFIFVIIIFILHRFQISFFIYIIYFFVYSFISFSYSYTIRSIHLSIISIKISDFAVII